MMRSVAVVLLIFLIVPSSLFGNETLNLSVGLQMLRIELLKSKESLQRLNEQVKNLEIVLKEAKKSLLTSENEFIISEQRISGLQQSLTEAQTAQQELGQKVRSSQDRLTMLSQLLQNSKNYIQQMEAEQIKEIGELAKSYERRLSIYKIVGGSLVAVIIVGAVYMIVK